MRYRRKKDYRYLERLLKQKGMLIEESPKSENGFTGSVLQINFNGLTVTANIAPPEKPVQEELPL